MKERKQKPGPQEERLVIEGDPAVALGKLLKFGNHHLRVKAVARQGEIAGIGKPYQYEVIGLPGNERALLWNPREGDWRMLRIIDDEHGEWEEYPSVDAALDTLRR